ncbi:fumarylacetoacetate hydrolase family protein [Halarchaeum nitratireducens]|uniref:2-hydroxyhepta-2,4-diene-1,7-dioate isomerase n=1 Tax=Halarchaeum nitratireducens TaxID=489913 RepID=A0A830GC50_9EURY|nr:MULTISPECIES: fumarylacetoacetate hydrolase family protein [Halarchaeum]MBP2252351.1 2-dehydro-3-deoxy-D-arabinonate dehydratase [Halarchaeum solikamskense]GGN20210.1 2-hydroxyhepta-2,4-diene-1,7-dioate isomerase [Halarchaeum nitratireducens]
MRYYRLPRTAQSTATASLVAVDTSGDAHDLTTASPDLGSFTELARAANASDRSIDAIARDRLGDADPLDPTTLRGESLRPVVPDEVWAAGVTYQISEEARKAESGKPEVYIDVYESERPEVFFKATPSRTVGPNDAIGVRADSAWDVPEPELGVVLHRGSVVGYTVGNDVSSREIEGENPLYLPQAKVYDRCCSIGPCVATGETVEDPHDLTMTLAIERDGDRVYEGSTSTSEMATTCETLVEYLSRHNDLPETVVLLTGTALVPPDGFTLTEGDEVRIDIENIGQLVNRTISV